MKFEERVDPIYGSSSPRPPRHHDPRMYPQDRVHALYSRDGTPKRYNKQNGLHHDDYNRFDFEKDPRGYEKTIRYFDCLFHLMTACGLLLILFAILVPICTIVLTVIQGIEPLHAPGYIAPFVFIAIVICVFLSRSNSRKVNRLFLFIAMAVLSAIGIIVAIGLIVVAIIGLNRDSPQPYGVGSGLHPMLMEMLAMECVIVSSGVICVIVCAIELGISIYFSHCVYNYFAVPASDTPAPEKARTQDKPKEKKSAKPAKNDSPAPTPIFGGMVFGRPPSESSEPVLTKMDRKQSDPERQEMSRMMNGKRRESEMSGKRRESELGTVSKQVEETSMARAQTAPRTAFGQRPVPRLSVAPPTGAPVRRSPSPRPPSQASLTGIEMVEDEDDYLGLPDTPTNRSSRRWGKTKNVLRAIMDIKQ